MSDWMKKLIGISMVFCSGVMVGKIIKSQEVADKIDELYKAGGYVVWPEEDSTIEIEVEVLDVQIDIFKV